MYYDLNNDCVLCDLLLCVLSSDFIQILNSLIVSAL